MAGLIGAIIGSLMLFALWNIDDSIDQQTHATNEQTNEIRWTREMLETHRFELPACAEDDLVGWVNYPPQSSTDLKCVHPDNLTGEPNG